MRLDHEKVADRGVRAVLADGQVVLVRQLEPADRESVLGLYLGLDEQDRHFRFFGPLPPKVGDLVAEMTGRLDARHGAMGAFRGRDLVGMAHYAVLTDPTEAEIAFAVSGAMQKHGVGTLLLEHLASLARRQGIRRFVAEVLSENSRMLRVFTHCGLPVRMSREYGQTHVELVLDEVETYLDAMAERERVAETASLRTLLRPRSVVVIGAGREPESIGNAVLHNILAAGFTGEVYAVNPHARQILDVPAFPTVGEVPVAGDLAVLCVPAAAVPEVAEQCGARGIRALVVISAGITGEPGLPDRLLAAVRRYGMRMVGPNCVGITNGDPDIRLDATFAPRPAPAGSIGLVTQSGGIGIALREQLRQLDLGVSVLVSTGDKYDVSGNDLLHWWHRDEATSAVVLYLESFGNPRKFGRLCRMVARTKPVLAVRAGSTEAAQRAAASHTAAAATPAVTRDALFQQAGVITVDTAAQLIETLAGLAWQPLPTGNRIAVVTNAGGAGVLAADATTRAGVVLAELDAETLAGLRAILPATASVANPVDTTAAVRTETMARCVSLVRADPGVDAVIVATVPTAVGDPGLAGSRLAPTDTPVLAVRLGQAEAVVPVHDATGRPRTASYHDPAAAVAVLGRMAAYARWLDRADRPAVVPADVDVPRALAVLRGRFRAHPEGGWLDPLETVELLRCFGIPVVDTRFATDADTAADAFAALGGVPVVVKAVADAVLHKSRQGGVLLDVRDAVAVRAGVRVLRDRFGPALRGVLLQPMVASGRELLVGVHSDAMFGPLVVFGLGGVDTDLVADRVARLAPLSELDADDLLHGLRSSAALLDSAASPALDVVAIRDVLVRIGLLAQLLPEVAELDLNPLVAWRHGCLAVDARIRVAPAAPVDPFLPALRG